MPSATSASSQVPASAYSLAVASQQLEHLGRERARDRRIRTLGHHGHHRRCHLLVAHPHRDTGAASRRPIEVIGTEAELEPTVLRTVVAEAARDVDAEGTQLRVADGLTFDEDRDLRRASPGRMPTRARGRR